MRAAVNTFVRFCVVLAIPVLLTASPARAEDSGQQGAGLFVPSLLIRSGVTGQVWDATLRSETCRGCTLPNANAAPLRPSESGDDFDVTPFVGGVLELMTPELSVPGSPRFFVGGEFAGAFGIDRKIAREGDPSTVSAPLPEGSATPYQEGGALGQGSETIATMGDYLYGAHAGVAVPFELWGRALRIRTSVGWLRYEVNLEGIVTDAECTQVNPTTTQCNPNFGVGGFQRAVTLTGSTSEEFDGIGPGLDLEMDTGRFGPVGSSILIGVQFYRILGNREVDFSSPAVTVSDSLGTDQNQAHFGYEADEWMYRLGVGIRFSWLGFEEK
jgi:hypothetical protein